MIQTIIFGVGSALLTYAALSLFLPTIVRWLRLVRFVNSACDSWTIRVNMFVLIVTVMVRQWLNGNVIKVGKGEYVLDHVLDGSSAKFRVKRIVPAIIDVQNARTGESLLDDDTAKYLIYETVDVTKEFPLDSIRYYEDGTRGGAVDDE